MEILRHQSEAGSVLLIVVLLVALLAAVVMGHLQVSTEEMQIMQNQIGLAEAQALAETGLHEALAQRKQDPDWQAGWTDRPLGNGSCTIVVEGPLVTATAVTARGYVATIRAEVAREGRGAGDSLQIDSWWMNP